MFVLISEIKFCGNTWKRFKEILFVLGSRGKEFLVLFTPAYFDDLVTKSVYITSDNGAEMNISTSQRLDPNLKSQIDRTDNISTVEHIIFPIAFELKSFKKELKSAIIKTSKDVFVISHDDTCLLYTSPSPRDLSTSRMPSSA